MEPVLQLLEEDQHFIVDVEPDYPITINYTDGTSETFNVQNVNGEVVIS